MDNSETLATLGTKYRTKTNKMKNTTQKTKKMSNTDPNKNTTQKTKQMSNTDPIKNTTQKDILIFVHKQILRNKR